MSAGSELPLGEVGNERPLPTTFRAPTRPLFSAELAAEHDVRRRRLRAMPRHQRAYHQLVLLEVQLEEVARVEGISPYTVGDHVKAIYRKRSRL